MKKYDVYGIGNALVDTEYEVDDEFIAATRWQKGIMTLIEAGDRAELIHLLEQEHEHRVIKLAGGGSAANTIVIVSQLGGDAFYSCKVANDRTGDFFVKDLAIAGVDTNLTADREPGVTGECISMVTPDAERTMTTHLGITQNFSVEELIPDSLANSTFLYIEGYLVSSPSAFEAVLRAQSIARSAGVTVSLTLSDPAMVENFKAEFEKVVATGVDMLFCNEDEAKLWTGAKTREDVISAIRNDFPKFAITCGRDGAIVGDGRDTSLVPGILTTPVDTTGAGDIFAGSFLFALSRGQSFRQAARLANQSASLLISNFGARLSTEDVETHLSPLSGASHGSSKTL
jgi:sugar/nucleoside kinase (ribokinase family)